jgi:protein-S-isoprenylcysteine O-methyltransferase Ste14
MHTTSSAIKTGLFTLFVPLVVAVYVPQRIIASDHANGSASLAWRVVGTVLLVLGTIGYLWCAALFVKAQGTPAPIFPTKRAVVTGLYRVNRNPMYTSVLAIVFGQAIYFKIGRVAWYGVFLFVCFHLFVLFYEERDLRARFNGEYEEFCRQVPRCLPRVSRSSKD